MSLEGKKAIMLVHHHFEDLELWYPVYRAREAGMIVDFVGEHENETYIGKYGVPAKADFAYHEVNPAHYDALFVPGGWAPDKMRRFPEVLSIVQHMEVQKKPIAQICHAGWVLISANILQGKHVTSTPGIKDDMVNAGAIWSDEEVVVDGHLVSSRKPGDLPAFMRAFVQIMEERF